MGKEVFGPDDESIGEVSDLVVQKDGETRAALIDVGGFLGVGEKEVAIPFDQIEVAAEEGGEPRLTIAMSREELEQLPAFEDRTMGSDDVASTDGAADTSTAPAEDLAATETTEPTAEEDVATTEPAAGETSTDTTEPAAGEDMGADTTEPAAEDLAATETTEPAAGEDMANDATQPAAEEPAIAETEEPAAPAEEEQVAEGEAAAPADGVIADDTQLSAQDLSADDLIGTAVYGADDETIGEVGDVIFGESGGIQAIVVDVGGFLGIGEKPVAVQFDALNVQKDTNGATTLRLNATQEQLENAPAYQEEAATVQ
jgi:sporulation protein YlmC with PRC-barrel domain